MRVKTEDRVVLSSTHPCLDHLVDAKVVATSLGTYSGLLTLEWKENWGSFDDLSHDNKTKTPLFRRGQFACTSTSTTPTGHGSETRCACSRPSAARRSRA